MKRSSLFCAGWWPFVVLPLLLLLLLLFFKWHPIEEDVAKNASAELNASGQGWAKVETFNRGREVLITGTPPNKEAIDVAKQAALKGYGVNTVTLSPASKVAEAPAIDPELNLIVTGDSIVLRGALGDQASIDTLATQAQATFGPDNVVNKLSIVDNTSHLPNLSGFFDGLAGKAEGLSSLTVSLKENLLTLRGEVQSEQIKSAVGNTMEELFSTGVSNQLTVAPAPVAETTPAPISSPPTITIARDDCQALLNELLSESKINFASGKAVISQDSYSLLGSIAETTKRCPDATFEVSGHTDSVGRLSLNMNLSEKRAQAVVAFLLEQGSDAARFSSSGYGPNQPIGDNATAAGRAQNRRIEFKLKN